MTFTIRPMQTDDLEQVSDIDTLSFSMPWRKDSFQYELANPVSLCRVAEVTLPDGARKIAGVMVTWIIFDEAEVATIAVHPQFRRQGIARNLMQATLETCKELAVSRVFLEVRLHNEAAQALYHRFGFVVKDVRRGYYADNHEDALVMVLEGFSTLTRPH